MTKISLEVREGEVLTQVAVQAESIRRAVSIVKGRYPGREVRIVFPIDTEEFFIEGPEEIRPDESRQPLHGSFTKV
jgi:ribosomal protein L14E/L6E/L27E